jgi:branched-chain amino acid transport system permease protein
VLAAYLALVTVMNLDVNPFAAMLIVVPLIALLGYALQRFLLNITLGRGLLSPLLVTFGLSVILQNGLLSIFSADSRRLPAGSIEMASLSIVNGLSLGVLPLLMFAAATLVIAGVELLFARTSLGRAFRATSDDAEIAQLMGRTTGMYSPWPWRCPPRSSRWPGSSSPSAPISIRPPGRCGLSSASRRSVGGLGSLWGTLAGGIVLGVAQTIGAQIDPGYQVLAGHLVFFLILTLRPRGLFPRMDG